MKKTFSTGKKPLQIIFCFTKVYSAFIVDHPFTLRVINVVRDVGVL